MFLRLESRQSRLNTSPAWSSYSWPMTNTLLQLLGPWCFDLNRLKTQRLSDSFLFCKIKFDVAVNASDHGYLQVDITTTSSLYTRSVLNLLLCDSTIESFELAEPARTWRLTFSSRKMLAALAAFFSYRAWLVVLKLDPPTVWCGWLSTCHDLHASDIDGACCFLAINHLK